MLQIQQGVIGAGDDLRFGINHRARLAQPVCLFLREGEDQTAGLHERRGLLILQGDFHVKRIPRRRKRHRQRQPAAVPVEVRTVFRLVVEQDAAAVDLISGKYGRKTPVLAVRVVLPAVVLDAPGSEVIAVGAEKFVDILQPIAVILIGKYAPPVLAAQQRSGQKLIVHQADLTGYAVKFQPVAVVFHHCPRPGPMQR